MIDQNKHILRFTPRPVQMFLHNYSKSIHKKGLGNSQNYKLFVDRMIVFDTCTKLQFAYATTLRFMFHSILEQSKLKSSLKLFILCLDHCIFCVHVFKLS